MHRADDLMFVEVEFVYGSRHDETNYKRVCSLSQHTYEVKQKVAAPPPTWSFDMKPIV